MCLTQYSQCIFIIFTRWWKLNTCSPDFNEETAFLLGFHLLLHHCSILSNFLPQLWSPLCENFLGDKKHSPEYKIRLLDSRFIRDLFETSKRLVRHLDRVLFGCQVVTDLFLQLLDLLDTIFLETYLFTDKYLDSNLFETRRILETWW